MDEKKKKILMIAAAVIAIGAAGAIFSQGGGGSSGEGVIEYKVQPPPDGAPLESGSVTAPAPDQRGQ